MRKLAPLAALLLLPLLAGCVSHTATNGAVVPTPADQVAAAENVFEIAALGVETWADFADLPSAQRLQVYGVIDAARSTVAKLKADFEAGHLDVLTVLRRIREAATELRQNRSAVVSREPKARQPRAMK